MNLPVLKELSYTVRARIEIGKLAGHSMQEFFNELGKGNEEKSTELIISAIEIMHNAWLRRKAADDNTEFAPAQFDREQFMELTAEEWDEVETAVVEQIKADSKQTVETESKKKEKDEETQTTPRG